MTIRSVCFALATTVALAGPALAKPCWGAPMPTAGAGVVPFLVLALAGYVMFRRRRDGRADMSA